MTEAEIMKALECHKSIKLSKCGDCPYFDIYGCAYELSGDVLELLNRKNAEIERLKKIINTSAIILPARKCGKTFLIKTTIEKITESARTAARAEAIKEFAERLKEKYKRHFSSEWSAVYNPIDQIAKEMGVE